MAALAEIGKIQRTVSTIGLSREEVPPRRSPGRLPWRDIDNPGEGSFPLTRQ